ncbi:MAG: tripartite tricarboxylate transporter substrate-binding protein [Alphaproteobacteria bacterium]|nr:tripartite tricarboxylate transporter substrate-binding protein [Alphaproteobacteria bacterium]
MTNAFRLAALCAIAGASLAIGPVQAAEKGAAYFNGKTLTWVVGSAPGGGHDFFARLISRHIKKAIPGLSTAVKNRPGAGHIIAANLVYSAKPNGLTVGSFTTGLVYSQIQNKKGIRFDLAKMSWIGKAQSDWRVASVAVNSKEYKTIQDVFNSKRPVKFSASGIGAGSYNDAFMFSTAYNIPRKIIVGYSGSAAALGMLRGETDVLMGGMSSGLSYVRAGQLRIVLQFGKVLPGIPDARDFAKTPVQKALSTMMENQGKLSRITAGPPDIVPDRLAALRAGYKTAVTSKALVDEAKRAKRDLDPMIGEDVRQAIVAILNQPPEIMGMLSALSQQKVSMVEHSGPVTKIKRGGRRIIITVDGKELTAKVSGSRTTVTIDGKKTKRKNVKVGMTCTFTWPRANSEAKRVDCKG